MKLKTLATLCLLTLPWGCTKTNDQICLAEEILRRRH